MWGDGTGGPLARFGGNALAGAVMTALWAMPAAAQQAQGQASALILDPMSLMNVEQLDFGSIIPSAAIGYVTVAPDGTVTTSGGVVAVSGDARPARFAGQGSANRVVIKTGSNQIFLTGPGEAMRVDDFEIGALTGLSQIGNGNNYRITGANGMVGFAVGGRLRVNANQAEGDYSGSFSVTFNYQ
jgi:hypothetical protein